jgi:predicted DNA-binding protein (MmcQ/YjbR family)
MNVESAREYCLAKKATIESFPFDEYSLVIKVMDKMFILIDLESAKKICLKCDPDYILQLKDQYNAVSSAPYFNKKYWIQVEFNLDVDDSLLKQLIDKSYDAVIEKFTKKMKTEYDAND